MTRRSRNARTSSSGLFSVSACVVAVSAFVLTEAQNVSPPLVQSAAADSRAPAFETAVVSENTSGNPPIGGTRLDTRGYFSAAKVTLRQLIQTAYRRHALDRRVIEGGPTWIDLELFNIDAKAAGEHSLEPDGFPRQSLLMLRTLLAEQFKLKLRTEVREVPVYALVLARSDGTLGPRLRKSDIDCAEAVALMIKGQRPKANCGFQEYGSRRYVPSVLTVPDIASMFSELVDRPVIDRTGLSGHFAADLEGVELRPPGPFDPGYGPSDVTRAMFTALPAELGLKLEATTAPVEVLVIEDAANLNKPDPLPLVVERAEVLAVDPATRRRDQISVSVHNATDKTIVAWGVRAQIEFADGKTRPEQVWTDGVEYRDLGLRGSKVLSPDGRYTITFGGLANKRPAKDVRAVTARATFVVFDDDTALGDERTLSRVFKRRAENQRAWPVVEKAFADAMARSADPREVLLDADKALEAITEEGIRNSSAYRWIRLTLGTNLKYARDFELFLNNTLEEMSARRAAAEAHFQRRK